MPIDKKHIECENEKTKLTATDLNTILEVNKKSIEIHIAVMSQFEDIIENVKAIKTKIEELDKNLFKLVVIFGSIGVGTIIGLIQLFLGHK